MFRADSANAGRGAAPARVRAIRWAEVLTALALASPAPVRVAGDRSAANPGPAPALEASGAAPRAGVGKAAAHAVTLARGDAAASPAAPAGGARCEELRGIWIPTDGPRDWDTLMRRLRAAGLNAVFVRVAQGGKAIYPSRVLPQDHWAADAGGDELERAIVAAHRHGLEFHAWKVCFHLSSAKARPAGTAAREFYERVARDDRLVRDSKGTQSYWLNPADPRNQDLELRVAREVAENYAVDGYHLDYIRYPDAEPGFDFHFGAVSRREFEKSLGRPVADWPTAVISGVLKQRYEDWERDNITGLVRRIRAELIARRPGTLLSAAVWRNVHFNRATVKQDWPRWGREGLVDFLVPMVYVIDPDEFRSTLARDFSTVCGRVPFLAGIGSWRLKSTGALVDQVRSARQLGADGFVLFSADAAQIDEQLEALAAAATKQPALPGIGLAWFEFDLPAESARRRYNYPAVEAGRATTLTVRLRRCAAGFGENLPASVSVEDLSGRPIGAPQRFALAPGDTQSVSFVPAGAPQRLVLRYRLGRSSAASRSFVVRGPILEPLPGREVAALRADDQPPTRSGSDTHVGVYDNGVGADGIFETLSGVSGITPLWIHQLRASHLAAVDVLVLPQFYDLADLTPEVAATLRSWVEHGGRLILTRDAVGLRWHPRLFPEVGVGERIAGGRTLDVRSALPGFPKGARLDHENADHAQLRVASSAQVLIAERKTGKPIVAAGRMGKGTVILDGLIPGYAAESPSDSNACRLLAALVQYR